VNTRTPLANVTSLKLKLSLLVVASTVAVLVVAAIGRRAGVPSYVSGPVTIVAALGVTYWLARGMVAPLRDMAVAARRMAQGDWSERIAVTSRDEVGQLAESFNAMATDLATHDQQRRALIATVSHELRTPLAAQRAVLENLADGVVAPDARTLGTALAQSERLSDLVRDLLDLSRIDGGAASLDLGSIGVRAFLEDCVAEAELRSREVAHEIVVEPTDLEVRGDAARLAQVVMNLVDNADRHSPAGGTVRLTARADGDQWVLDVRDEGPGIPAEQRSRLFQRFGTADTATGGSGLGLAIGRWICELHGGRIDAIEAPEGAHIRVTLPRNPIAALPRPDHLTTVTAPAAPAPRHTQEEAPMTKPVIPGTPATPTTLAAPVPPAPTAPAPATAGPTPSASVGVWESFWPERVTRPQVLLVAAAAVVGLLAAWFFPRSDGPGITSTVVLALGGSLAFVANKAWRSRWALAVWAICLVGAGLLTVRVDQAPILLGLLVCVPLFTGALTGARTLIGYLAAAVSWPLAALRGLPLLGRTIGAISLRRNLWVILRAAAVTVVAVVIFGALFASADAIVGNWFSSLIPNWRWDELTARVFIWVFVTGLTLTAAYLGLNPSRLEPSTAVQKRPLKNAFEWMLPVGAVLALFVIFLVAQASALFGGHDYVLRATNLTYAEYARQGFGQLLVVTLLTIGVLALIRFYVPESTAGDLRLKRGAVIALVALALLVVVSALHRLALYQEAYGYSTARIGAIAVEVWLALALVLVGAAALGWQWRWAVRTAVAAAAILTLAMPLVNVDARVVELNAERFRQTGQIDVAYLQQLNQDGADAIESALPKDLAQCALVSTRYDADKARGWIDWNAGVDRRKEVLARVGEPRGNQCAAYAMGNTSP
jgi:signal transduction histidine kinase